MENEETLSFIDYVITYHKDVSDEYTAYFNRSNLPKVGDRVKTLVSGYGGYAGVVRRVVDIDDRYITVSDNNEVYLCLVNRWWKELVVVKDL